MRIYLAAAMTNAARNPGAVGVLLSHLEALGHEVPTSHVAAPDGRSRDAELTNAQLAQRDLSWVASCDAVVAEVSTPSHGVGIEVLAATRGGKPVLLLHSSDAAVSRLLLGLAGVETCPYVSVHDACGVVDAFLARIQARAS